MKLEEKFFDPKDLTIQTFDDSEDRKNNRQSKPELARIFRYDLRKIKELQKLGAGVYFTINTQENPNKRGIDNTCEFAGVGLDLDVAKERYKDSKTEITIRKRLLLQQIRSLEKLPNYLIETKNGYQPLWYWKRPIPLKTLKERNEANEFYQQIVAGFEKATGLQSEGDNLARVLRQPNTIHEKNPKRPFWIKCYELNPEKVDFEKFIETYPPLRAPSSTKISEIASGVPEGSRNVDATSMVGSLLAKYKPEEWESVVWPLFRAWNLRCDPPQQEKVVRGIYERISKKELAKRQQNPQGQQEVVKPELLDRELTYGEVEEKVKQFLPNLTTALKLALAVAVSSQHIKPALLWLLLVGVPSSGKTDLVRLLRDAEISYFLDNLTQNAFVSGERETKNSRVYDLLPLLDKKSLIIKDWTSILSLDEKMTKKLLGDMVNIYDKEFSKFSSRRGNVRYASAFSQIGCITPATLNKHTTYMNMVGPRFLHYIIPSTTEGQSSENFDRIFSGENRSELEKEARLYVSSYLNQLAKKPFTIKSFSPGVRQYLQTAATLVPCCRGIVVLQSASFKNEKGDDVRYHEVLDVQVEDPWRAAQQLIFLAEHLAYIIGNDKVWIEELEIIKDVVLSSMPADRAQALRVIKEHGGAITPKLLSELADKSNRTCRRLLDELAALKVLDKIKGFGSIPTQYKISEKFSDFLLLDPTEFMSSYIASGTETPHGIDVPPAPGQLSLFEADDLSIPKSIKPWFEKYRDDALIEEYEKERAGLTGGGDVDAG